MQVSMGNDGGLEIRAARAEEADDTLRVLCAAFGLSFDAARPFFYRDPFFDLSHKRLLRTAEDGILSCLTVVPTQIRVGNAWVPLGGIAGMATRPDRQREGWGGRLLAATVPALADELGYPLSGLFPATEDFYRRFGWETASRTARWRGRCDALPTCPESRFARPLNPDDGAEREAIHRIAAMTGRTGTCERDPRRWQIIEAAPEREWLVYQAPGEPVTGYAAYEKSVEGAAVTLHLRELRALTPTAPQGLIGHFARYPLPDAQMDWLDRRRSVGAGRRYSEPGMMLRLTDLTAALAAIHAANLAPVLGEEDRTLTVRARDPLRPANQCPVRLTAAGVESGTDTDPDWIAADIRDLAPLYLGHHTPSDVQARGRLRASSPAALALADQLFPPRAPFVAPLDQF